MNDVQKRLSEIEAQEKALADEKAKLLAESKEADLKLVRELCKRHGFTATQLRGYLTGRGKRRVAEDVASKDEAVKLNATKKAKTK